jgi:hypothetical protein
MQKLINVLFFGFIYLFLLNLEIFAENKNLFKIERNKNTNAVMYDARLDPYGKIDNENPIDSYWILNEKQGQRQEIKGFEKRAYGYTVTKNGNSSYVLVLQAVKDRSIEIVLVNGDPKAVILINNEQAYLSSVYVSANDALIPKVYYLLLTGTNPSTGEQVTEKIIQNKQ